MRKLSKLLLGAAGLAALAGAAFAADRDSHVLKVMLPDGSIEQIRYTGDVAPHIVLVPAQNIVPVALGDPFAEMDRVFAAMDAHADAMLRQVAGLQQAMPASGQGGAATLASLPPGTASYSFTSFSSNGTGCSQSVQVTALEQGKPPKIVRQQSGDCSAMSSRAPTPAVQQAAPALRPEPIPAAFHPAAAAKQDGPSI